MSSASFNPSGDFLEMGYCSQNLVGNFWTAHKTSPKSNHPPMFGLKYSKLLSRSFDCQFEPSEGDLQTIHSHLSAYIENIVLTTGLPFSVTIASLIILQRMCTRLPPNVYRLRAQCTAHRLFTGAYILAAKQYAYMKHALEQTHLQPLSDLPAKSWTILSNAYWAQISSYDVTEVQQLQTQILFVVGRNVAVFPVADASIEAYIKKMNSLPMHRNLPLSKDGTLRNLSRMTLDESCQYFEFLNVGSKTHRSGTAFPRPSTPEWLNRRAQSYA